MAKKNKGGLGRGLNALFGDTAAESGVVRNQDTTDPTQRDQQAETIQKSSSVIVPGGLIATQDSSVEANKKTPYSSKEAETGEETPREVALDDIEPNPDQPRTQFKEEELEELAQSIKNEGLLQPILVRKVDDKYQIIAGERRWQACKKIGLDNVPVRVVDASDDKAIELALIENIQREDLNPIEEALGYRRLMESRNMTQAEVAQAVSKGRSTIANALRLLELPEEAQNLLYEGKITAGHARAILSIPDQAGRETLTRKLKDEQLSVREAESIARLLAGSIAAHTAGTPKREVPAYFKKAARNLSEKLETSVKVKTTKGRHKIEIEFKDEEEFKRIFERIIDGQES